MVGFDEIDVFIVGWLVGTKDGIADFVGRSVGIRVGHTLGCREGGSEVDGFEEGIAIGYDDGALVGTCVNTVLTNWFKATAVTNATTPNPNCSSRSASSILIILSIIFLLEIDFGISFLLSLCFPFFNFRPLTMFFCSPFDWTLGNDLSCYI